MRNRGVDDLNFIHNTKSKRFQHHTREHFLSWLAFFNSRQHWQPTTFMGLFWKHWTKYFNLITIKIIKPLLRRHQEQLVIKFQMKGTENKRVYPPMLHFRHHVYIYIYMWTRNLSTIFLAKIPLWFYSCKQTLVTYKHVTKLFQLKKIPSKSNEDKDDDDEYRE